MLNYIKEVINHEIVDEVRIDKCERLYAFYLKQNSSNAGDYTVCGFIKFGDGDSHHILPHTISYNALKDNYKNLKADAMVLLHNHPKTLIPAKLAPSDNDIEFTYGVSYFADTHNMQVLDHIVVDHKNYYSFVENELMDVI